MIRAVVFDFDGLILNTERVEYDTWQQMYREANAELPLKLWQKCIGTHADFFDPIAYLEEQIGKSIDKEAFHAQHRKKLMDALEKEQILPGVEDHLRAAKGLGLKVGLASSSHYDWVSGHLHRLGLFDKFDCIRTADDVEEVKPNPSLYLQAAECLGVKPEEAIAFEDSVNGAIAAKKAGMYCVAVPNEVTESMVFESADHRLQSLAEMELVTLISFLTDEIDDRRRS